jgi:hypothetical protein
MVEDSRAVLTLADLRELCDRYVPVASRHPASLLDVDEQPPPGAEWWHAHELGHMLTVPLGYLGQPFFCLGDGTAQEPELEHERQCYELAAMSISRRLLIAAGRRDVVRAEEDRTGVGTLNWQDRGDVRRILLDRGCLWLPRTRAGIEGKLLDVVAAARGAGVAI